MAVPPGPVALPVDTSRVQYLAIVGSALLIAFIFQLTRRKRIRVQYSLVWFCLGAVSLVLSIWRDGLEVFARLVGVAYAPAALFLVLLGGVFALLIHFSVVISSLAESSRALTQETALLREQLERTATRAAQSTPSRPSEEEHS